MAVSLPPVPMATVTSWGPGDRAEQGAGKLESFLPRSPSGQEQIFHVGGGGGDVTQAHVCGRTFSAPQRNGVTVSSDSRFCFPSHPRSPSRLYAFVSAHSLYMELCRVWPPIQRDVLEVIHP